MVPDDDERPKKSWRDIDKMRDGSQHRREERPNARAERGKRSAEYRSYKTQLNKLFDGTGAMPDALKARLSEAGDMPGVKERKEGLDAIKQAGTPAAVKAAFEAFRAAHGFPEDEEVLGKLLDLSDEAIVLEAIETIDRLRGEGKLKRGSSFRARLDTVQMTLDDPKVQAAARALLRQLR